MEKDSQTAFEKEYSKKILTQDYYNGRVNIIEQKDPDAIFKMQERIDKSAKSHFIKHLALYMVFHVQHVNIHYAKLSCIPPLLKFLKVI